MSDETLITKLVEYLNKIQACEEIETIQSQSSHHLIKVTRYWASLALVGDNGQPDSAAISQLQTYGFRVSAGETDDFGWLSGCIQTTKGWLTYC